MKAAPKWQNKRLIKILFKEIDSSRFKRRRFTQNKTFINIATNLSHFTTPYSFAANLIERLSLKK